MSRNHLLGTGALLKPFYQHAGITIYHGDCREVLPQLPKGWCSTCSCELADEMILAIHLAGGHKVGPYIDVVVTDPPYGTGWVRGGKGVGEFEPKHEIPEWDVFTTDWIDMITCEAFAVFSPANRQLDLCAALGAFAVLYYRKTNPQPLGPTREAIVCKPAPWGMPSWEFSAYNGDAPLHPCQKPAELLDWLILGMNRDRILDPFAGSGTTLLAAKGQNRRAIGIEIEEKYCEIAAKRLSQEVFQFE